MNRRSLRSLGLVALLATAAVYGCGDPETPKPATKLGVATAPSASPASRAAFATQPVIQIQNADGGAVGQAGVVVTASITSGGGTLGGTTTATTDGTGKATFTNLMITGTTGERVLTFSATGLTSTTATVNLVAGAATTMAANAGNGQSATVGTAVANPPQVLVTDADGNPVPNVAVTFAVASGGGSVTGANQTTSAAGTATVGSWTLGSSTGTNTLTASSTGLTSVTFSAIATSTPGGATNVSFCGSPVLWFAYQNGTSGTWTQLAAKSDGTYDVPITSVGGIAFAQPGEGGAGITTDYSLGIIYLTKTELATLGCALGEGAAVGTKTINGSVSGVTASQMALISFGSQVGFAGAGGPTTFQITGAPDGAHDLIASRGSSTTSSYVPDRYIVRRALNPANGSTLPTLDFAAAEAVAPTTASLTISNVGTDSWFVGSDVSTANLTTAFLLQVLGTGTGTNVVTSYQVPAASQRLSTDNYRMFAFANTATDERGYQVQNMSSFGARTVTLGPVLSTPTVTSPVTSPNIRMRVVLPSQSQYGGGVSASYDQTGTATRDVFMFMSAGYLGGTPTTWDMSMPDFTGVAGYNTAWGLQPGTTVSWYVEADSGIPVGLTETSVLFAAKASGGFASPGRKSSRVLLNARVGSR